MGRGGCRQLPAGGLKTVAAAVAVNGGGPAGLMAAEVLAGAGCAVTVYDRMPSVGRKLLMAGRGGLNLTHSEPMQPFMARYGAATGWLAPMIDAFPPDTLIAWAQGLGQATFVGSSGRIFPKALTPAPRTQRRCDLKIGWPDGSASSSTCPCTTTC